MKVKVHCRIAGACGIFETREFDVELRCPQCGYNVDAADWNGDHDLCSGAIPANDHAGIRDAWLAQHGEKWELHHIV